MNPATSATVFCDLGDRVLMLGRMVGRGRGSGVPVDTPVGILWDYRDGKCWRTRTFLDHGEAFAGGGPGRLGVRCRCPV